MRLQGVMQPLKDNMKFKSITEKISEKTFPINIYGISESGKSYIINGIFEENDNSMVVVTHSDVDAKNLYEDLSFYTTDVFYFPVREVVFYNVDAISGDLRWARLKVIKEILQNERKKIIVTSIDALTSLYTPKEYYLRYSMIIKKYLKVFFNVVMKEWKLLKEKVNSHLEEGYLMYSLLHLHTHIEWNCLVMK